MGKAVLRPVLKHDYVTWLRAKFRMELAAPCAVLETCLAFRFYLRGVSVEPVVEVRGTGPMVRDDDDLNSGLAYRRNQLTHIVIKTNCICLWFRHVVQFAALTHEVVVWVNDQECGVFLFIDMVIHVVLSLPLVSIFLFMIPSRTTLSLAPGQ